MAENTTVGPAGANSAPLGVTPHQTFGHLDDNADGGFGASNSDHGSVVAPAGGGDAFGGSGGGAPASNTGFNGITGPVEAVHP